MAENKETVVIDVQFDAAKIASEVQNTSARISGLRERAAELRAEFKKGGDITGELTAKMAANKTALQQAEKQQQSLAASLRILTDNGNTYGDSLDEQRRKLNDLQKAFDGMTKAQRESAKGQDIKKMLQDQTEAVSNLERETGRWQRNVGNYPSALQAIMPAFGKLQGMMAKFGVTIQSVGAGGAAAFGALTAGIKATMVAMLKFLATPAGLILAGIAAAVAVLAKAFGRLTEAFAKNDEAGTNWARLMAVFQPLITGINKAFDALALSISKAANAIAGWIGKHSDAVKSAQDLITATDDLQEAERQYTISSAKNSKDIAELRAKAAEKDKYTAEERKGFLLEAKKLEEENLKERKRIAEEKLRIAEEEAKKEADTSDETKDKIAQLTAAKYQAEQEYYTGIRRINSGIAQADAEMVAERKRNAEELRAIMLKNMEIEMRLQEMHEQGASALANYIEQMKKRAQERARIAAEAMQAEQDELDAMAEADLQEQSKKYADAIQQRNELRKRIEGETLKDVYNANMAALDEVYNAGVLKHEDYEQLKTQITEQYTAQRMEAAAGAIDAWGSQIMGTISAISEAMSATENAELENVKSVNKERQKDLEKSLKKGLISQEAYDAEVQRMQDEEAEKENEIKRDQAKRDKAIGLMQAVINTSAAIIGYLANPGGWAGIALSALAGVTGAAQIAAIAATPLPSFATGGIVPGNSYEGDNVLARVNSREMVLPQNVQADLWDTLNNLPSGGMDYDLLGATMADAVSELPAPIMIYKEFETFGAKTAQIRELSKA